MKQEIKILLSLVLTIIFGFVANATSSGVKTSGHYQGIIMVSVFVFFIIFWLLGRIEKSEYVTEIKEEKIIVKNVKNELEQYHESKNSFKYFSDDRLIDLHEKFKSESIENLERLALEEELVERRLIKSSPMHEKLYLLKKNIMN